jgi:hypothetical protein
MSQNHWFVSGEQVEATKQHIFKPDSWAVSSTKIIETEPSFQGPGEL